MTYDERVSDKRNVLASLIEKEGLLGIFTVDEIVALSGMEEFSPQRAIAKWAELQANPPHSRKGGLESLHAVNYLLARVYARYALHLLRQHPIPRTFRRTINVVRPGARSSALFLSLLAASTMYSWWTLGCEETFCETLNPKTHPFASASTTLTYCDMNPFHQEEFPLGSGKYPLSPLRFNSRFPGGDSSLILYSISLRQLLEHPLSSYPELKKGDSDESRQMVSQLLPVHSKL
jgi:hypothetical protein